MQAWPAKGRLVKLAKASFPRPRSEQPFGRGNDSHSGESIDEISGKYLGRPYPNFSGRPETRMIMTIEADSIRGMGAR